MEHKDTNVRFIRNLSDGGELFFLNNPAGIPYAVIRVGGKELWGTELKRVDFMIRDWEKIHGKQKPTKEELERYITFKSGYYTRAKEVT